MKCSLKYLQVWVTTLVSSFLATNWFCPYNYICLLIFTITSAYHFKERNIIRNFILTCAQQLSSRKPINQYALHSLIFSPLHSIINREQHKNRLLQSMQPLQTDMNCLSVKVHTPVIWNKSPQAVVEFKECIDLILFCVHFQYRTFTRVSIYSY